MKDWEEKLVGWLIVGLAGWGILLFGSLVVIRAEGVFYSDSHGHTPDWITPLVLAYVLYQLRSIRSAMKGKKEEAAEESA